MGIVYTTHCDTIDLGSQLLPPVNTEHICLSLKRFYVEMHEFEGVEESTHVLILGCLTNEGA